METGRLAQTFWGKDAEESLQGSIYSVSEICGRSPLATVIENAKQVK